MLHTVSWMVAREPTARRDRIYAEILASFLAGGIVGGALMGALIAVPAWGLYHLAGSRPGVVVALAASVAAAYALRAVNVWNIPKPQIPSQVPEAWRNIFSARTASLIYAAGLGMIYLTRIASLMAYPLAILLLGMGNAPLAIIQLMAVAGLLRAASAALVPLFRLDSGGSDAVLAFIQKYSFRHGDLIILCCAAVIPLIFLMS
jgi:hypothetical protein